MAMTAFAIQKLNQTFFASEMSKGVVIDISQPHSTAIYLEPLAAGETLPRTGPAREFGHVLLHGRSAALQWTLQCMLQPDKAARPTAQELIAQVHASCFRRHHIVDTDLQFVGHTQEHCFSCQGQICCTLSR